MFIQNFNLFILALLLILFYRRYGRMIHNVKNLSYSFFFFINLSSGMLLIQTRTRASDVMYNY